MIEVILLGTGSPNPDAARAGPSTLVRAGGQTFSVEEAAATAGRAGVGTFVLTHCVPAVASGQEDEWRAKAASTFDGRIEIGPDLHRIEVHAPA